MWRSLPAVLRCVLGVFLNQQRIAADALRILAADAVESAKSGHPGMPMGMADIAEVLWNRHLRHHPRQPNWVNRDRFVLSNGHGSMLQYALLHLSGYAVSIDDLKQFRQHGSKTPGHPEVDITPGVETTTGPLGQGLANAVGLALAERHLAARFNQPDYELVNYHTYCFVGDGCLMEGISHEACSLAGTWQLGHLIVLWDDNGISIDGKVTGWFTENIPQRFRAYGWQVIENIDGHDAAAIDAALHHARGESHKPTLICCRTTIGHGSPNLSDTAKIHGNPLGEEECEHLRRELNWPHGCFDVPDVIYDHWNATVRGQAHYDQWQVLWENYQSAHPALAAVWQQYQKGGLPADWSEWSDDWLSEDAPKAAATRQYSRQCITALSEVLPTLIGGAADVSDSVNTRSSAADALSATHYAGNYIHYGVREFAMVAIANGLALSGLLPFVGTYLVFSDYARNAIRLSALMRQRVVYIFSHDSVLLGEDGPTHQPIEQLASLRLIPCLHVWRPADWHETQQAWCQSVSRQDGPTVLALTRQRVAVLPQTMKTRANIARGGYVLQTPNQTSTFNIIATGSEVALALAAAAVCAERGQYARVISMPCVEVFHAQALSYQQAVLSSLLPTFVIEAGSKDAWYRFTDARGEVFGIDTFGESAPGAEVYQAMGFDADVIAAKMLHKLSMNQTQSIQEET